MNAFLIMLVAWLWARGSTQDNPPNWPTEHEKPKPPKRKPVKVDPTKRAPTKVEPKPGTPAPNPMPSGPHLDPIPAGFVLYDPPGSYAILRAKQQLPLQAHGSVVIERGPDQDLAYRSEPHETASDGTVTKWGITVYIRTHGGNVTQPDQTNDDDGEPTETHNDPNWRNQSMPDNHTNQPSSPEDENLPEE